MGCGIEILAPGSREENLQTHCGLLKHRDSQVLQCLAIPSHQAEVCLATGEGGSGPNDCYRGQGSPGLALSAWLTA